MCVIFESYESLYSVIIGSVTSYKSVDTFIKSFISAQISFFAALPDVDEIKRKTDTQHVNAGLPCSAILQIQSVR